MEKAIICDLDGTLVRLGNRNVYDASKTDVLDYLCNPVALKLFKYKLKGYEIIFLTGREEKYRIPSEKFIDKFMNWKPDDYILLMRDNKNFISSSEMKKKLYLEHIKDKYDVESFFEDHEGVIKTFNSEFKMKCIRVFNQTENGCEFETIY
jgi:hydroxymethylpyrimidine pyrophosphatase-like HAD family hydrolase